MMYFLLLTLVVLNVADVVLTNSILKNGGRELNPFLEPLFNRYNPVMVMVVAKLVYLAPLAIFIKLVPVAVLYVLITLYTALLLWNVKEYIKQRNGRTKTHF